MINRWSILFVLFLARMAMAFQFQEIAAISPVLMQDFGIGLVEIGLLIGLYLAPGVIIAVPGGAVAARFGEKRVVALSMVLMLIGGLLVNLSPSWNTLMVGRIIGGVGGVVVNVVMTKMLVDWFTGREISTALAIFVTSWPIGIALALVVLPGAAQFGGAAAAWWTVTGIVGAALILFAAVYRPPEGLAAASTRVRLVRVPFYTLTLAGLIWALYNTALAMVFSFGPAFFAQRDWSLAEAGGVTSTFMLVFAIALPFGGMIADRTGARDTVILVSLISFVALMPVVLYGPAVALMPVFLLSAALYALAAGPIMTLPSVVLAPEARTFGMGVFFAIYYGVMMVGPRVAGAVADRSGDVGVAFVLGAAMSLACVIALWLFRKAVDQSDPAAAVP